MYYIINGYVNFLREVHPMHFNDTWFQGPFSSALEAANEVQAKADRFLDMHGYIPEPVIYAVLNGVVYHYAELFDWLNTCEDHGGVPIEHMDIMWPFTDYECAMAYAKTFPPFGPDEDIPF